MLIVNGVVHTMDGGVMDSGFVRTEGKTITQVGHMGELPGEAVLDTVIDAKGGHVLPGFIDAHCHLGLYSAGLGSQGDELNETGETIAPHLRALDGIDPLDHYFWEARRAGVTCVLTIPGSALPIGGQGVLIKTAGRVADQMVVRAPAAMKFALGENPRNTRRQSGASASRMATAAIIRESLERAMDRELKWAGAQDGDPESDIRLDALRPVATGKLPAHFHAHRADDIVTAVRLSKEFGLECTIVHGTEGHLIADYLAQEGVPVITGPILTDRGKPEMANLCLENTAILARAGVQVAICTDHPETPIQYLRLCAAMAAQAGMDEEEALAAITVNAACILGVDDCLGSLSEGKDADIVVLDGHPFDWRSKVTHVFIDGQEVDLT